MNIHTCTASEASARTRAAIPMIGFRSSAEAGVVDATVMAVPTADLEMEGSGFFWSWTVAWGRTFEPGVEAGTFAVSFFASAWRGAGATGLVGITGGAGGAGAFGSDVEGGTGAAGATGAVEGGVGGLGAKGGTVAAGGFGKEGTAGACAGGTTMPGAEGGRGIAGTEGGFGTVGIPGIGVGGFNPTGADGGGGTAGDPPGTGTGFGGRLIIAVSRGLEAMGEPSRRAGRTILTVSFLGSAIVCSEWVKQRLRCSESRYSQNNARVSIPARKIVA